MARSGWRDLDWERDKHDIEQAEDAARMEPRVVTVRWSEPDFDADERDEAHDLTRRERGWEPR